MFDFRTVPKPDERGCMPELTRHMGGVFMVGGISGVSYMQYVNPYRSVSYAQSVYDNTTPRTAADTQAASQVRAASETQAGQQVRMAVIPEAQTGTPVQPVNPVRQVMEAPVDKTEMMRKLLSDTTAMAVRSRIEYLDGNKAAIERRERLDDRANDIANAKSAQEVMEESECKTCESRKYQDGSDDPGVSFKTASHIAPEQAASRVRGHEMEHVGRERAEALRDDREVVSQSVTYQTDICPECGKVYVSGGTTRTVTAAQNEATMKQAQETSGYNGGFLAVA